ncbi:MAG: hypothetical protein RIR14_1400 [Pseudomonadota bacterium]|jgi:hypothetical protein
MPGFILVKIPPPEAPRSAVHASGGGICAKMNAASLPLCRPAGWVALWRRLGNLSVLNRLGSCA